MASQRTLERTISRKSSARVPDNRLQLVSCLDRLAPEALCEHVALTAFSAEREVWFAPEGVFHTRVCSTSVSAASVERASASLGCLSKPVSRMGVTLLPVGSLSSPAGVGAAATDGAVESLRYDAFRLRFGFCIAYWCITHPGVVLGRSAALRWALLSPPRAPAGHVFRRYLIRMFLAEDSSNGFEKDRYYACEEVSRDCYLPVDLHVLKLEHLRVILDWARRIEKIDGAAGRRAPVFPAGQLTKMSALDAIDKFCQAHRGQVIGPPLPRSRG